MNETHVSRRQELMNAIGSGVAILKNAAEQTRVSDTTHRYRHDSNFFYISGFVEPDSIIVLVGGKKPKTILFCREKNMERELWEGSRFGPKKAKNQFHFDFAYPIAEFIKRLPELIKQRNVFFEIGADPAWDTTILNTIRSLNDSGRRGRIAPDAIFDIRTILHEMRVKKDSHEIEIMREAAKISSAAHKIVMESAKSGMWEYQVEAQLLYEFHLKGAPSPAYTSVVASGKNACVLHYIENNCQLREGELLLIDAGCELHGYASDITRTFPIGKTFAGPQKEIYELVLDAQSQAINNISEGKTYNEPHEATIKTLSEGFIHLGLCKGPVDAVIEKEEYLKFYMHGTGHWLGMDVHDVGSYKFDDKWRKFEKGMVLTVEPGCYIRPGKSVPKHFWNIGIRIEDDVIVKENGCEVIMSDTPKTISDIEALRKKAYDL